MNKPTSTEPTEPSSTETNEKAETPTTSPRVKTLITGGVAVKSGVRAGAGGLNGPKLPANCGE